MAIDLAALKRAAEEFFETEVVDMFHYADGKTHTAYLLELDAGHDDDLPSEVIARVATTPRLERSVESEVATINFLSDNTLIPVPRVFYHNSSLSNAVGAQFIFQERLQGDPLSKALDDDDEPEYELSINAWHQLVLDYASIVSQLFNLRFDRIGALYEIMINDDGTDEEVQSYVGPTAESWFYRGKRGHLEHLEVGPWESSSDWLAALVSNEVRYLRTFPSELEDELEHELTRPGEEKSEISEIDLDYAIDGAEDRLRRLISLCNLGSGELGPDEDLVQVSRTFALMHANLLPHNIMIDMRTGKIKGIVGWTDASITPIWRIASIPYWLEWPTNPTSEWSHRVHEKDYSGKDVNNVNVVRNGVTQAEVEELANIYLEAVTREDHDQLFLLCLHDGFTDKIKILPHLLSYIWERDQVESSLEELEAWEIEAFGCF